MSFCGGMKVTADEFYNCWTKYDKDGNGFIDAGELNALLEDMVKASGLESSSNVLAEARAYYMGLLDENQDGKLDVNELAKLLVPEENFLLTFRLKEKLSSVDFMQIWRKYDTDKNGYIDKGELRNFLHDLLTRDSGEKVVSVQSLQEYQENILQIYDKNKDGRLEISELVGLLPVEENFLAKFEGIELSSEDFDEIFAHYDQDESGSIEGAELEGLMKDCIQRNSTSEPNYADLKEKAKTILELIDVNKDGKIQKDELKMLFKLGSN